MKNKLLDGLPNVLGLKSSIYYQLPTELLYFCYCYYYYCYCT